MWQFIRTLRKRPSRKIGLALGGGGVRGLAHIGVLKVLEREKVPIHFLAGTSMGGVIAAGYAAGLSAHDLEEEALKMSSPRRLITLLDRSAPSRGLLQGQKVMEYLSQVLGEIAFDELRVPLALVAVDLNGEQKVVLRQGRVLDSVRATIAFPGVFAPVERDGQLLVDGGLLDNLPADVVRQMGADVVVAVDVSTGKESVTFFADRLYRRRFMPLGLVGIVEVLLRSLAVMMNEIERRCLEEASTDLLIRPTIPSEITAFTGFTRAGEIIACGEQAAEQSLPHLQGILDGG